MNSFGVRAAYRGRGIGRALLEAGEALVCIITGITEMSAYYAPGQSRWVTGDL